jgi:hypothetical protein
MNEFPNLFYILGPNSGRVTPPYYVHSNGMSTIRGILTSGLSSVDLVINVARPILEGRAASIEFRKDAETE